MDADAAQETPIEPSEMQAVARDEHLAREGGRRSHDGLILNEVL